MDTDNTLDKSPDKATDEDLVVPAASLTSVALTRLVDEVRNGNSPVVEGYNRAYHRHNR